MSQGLKVLELRFLLGIAFVKHPQKLQTKSKAWNLGNRLRFTVFFSARKLTLNLLELSPLACTASSHSFWARALFALLWH